MSTFDQQKPPWTSQRNWELWRDVQLQSFALDEVNARRLLELLNEAALIGTCAAAECIRDGEVTSSYQLGLAGQRLLGLRPGISMSATIGSYWGANREDHDGIR